jgi:hypothetical protein
LEAILSVWRALSEFWWTLAAISSMADVVSSAEEDCSVAPC